MHNVKCRLYIMYFILSKRRYCEYILELFMQIGYTGVTKILRIDLNDIHVLQMIHGLFLCLNFKYMKSKQHSENSDTSMSVTFDLNF